MTDLLDRSAPPPAGPIGPFEFPNVARHVLANGVRVLVVPKNGIPVVSARVLVRGGASDEDPSQAGLAALTADLLESGAAGRDAAEIADALESLGVDVEVGAGWDGSHAAFTALASRTLPALDLLADLVQRPDFPAAEVDRLRDERLSEIVQRRALAGALADEAALRVIFGADARFGIPLGGVPSTVERISPGEVGAFHAARYVPDGTALIVVGDIDVDAAVRAADERFGAWAPVSGAATAPDVSADPSTGRTVIVDRAGAVQSEIRLGHLGVSRGTDDYFALVVMNAILGGSFSSRLNLNLREVHGYTYGASSAFGMRRQPGPFLVATATETGVTVPAIAEVFSEIRRFRDGGCTAAELEDARGYVAGVFPLRLQSAAGVAAHLAEMEIYDLPDDHFDRYRDRVLAVSADEVNEAARMHLHPDRINIVVAGDAARIRDSLGELRDGPIAVVASPEELA